MKNDPLVQTISFDEEGGIIVTWIDPVESDRYGSELRQSHVSPEAQESDQQLSYYAAELRQDVQEFLAAWVRFRR